MQNEVIQWLLRGDASIQYLTHALLLKSTSNELDRLQRRIEIEGFGHRLLSCQADSGHWGLWYYQPKWTCTHYTLYELKHLGIRKTIANCTNMVQRAFDECMIESGGVNFAKSNMPSDIAIDGMFLDYAAYFCPEDRRIEQIVSHLLSQRKPGGGYSWDDNATVGDAHTTICVLEGFLSYVDSGTSYKIDQVRTAISESIWFIKDMRLFFDDDKRYVKLTYPHRYRYDILRFLECATRSKIPTDPHIDRAIDWLRNKCKGGYWELEYTHPEAVHFDYETLHEPSRFLTLKALYILEHR